MECSRRAGGSGIRKADSDEGVWKSFGFLKNRGFPLDLARHIKYTVFYMGKNITRRNRKSKESVKKNLSKKTRGGGNVTPGARIDFVKDILSYVEQKIKYKITNLGFCDALHVRFLDDSNNDDGKGLFFFYNYTYKFFQRKAAQAKRIVGRTIDPTQGATVFGRTLARGMNAVFSQPFGYTGLSETAWIKSETAKFVEEIAKRIKVDVWFKETAFGYNPGSKTDDKGSRNDDMSDKKYDIFQNGYNGIYFMYSSFINDKKIKNIIVYKRENIYNKISIVNTISKDEILVGKRDFCIFKFIEMNEIINNFNSKIAGAINTTGGMSIYSDIIVSPDENLRVFQANFYPEFKQLIEIFKEERSNEITDQKYEEKNEQKYKLYEPTQSSTKSTYSQSFTNGATSENTGKQITNDINVTNGATSENTGKQIMDAINRNDINELRKQLLIADKIYNFTDEDGRTPLYLAVKQRKLDAINELIQYPWVDVNFKNKQGYSLLHFAIGHGDVEVIKILIQRSDLLIDEEVFNLNSFYNKNRPNVLREIEQIFSYTGN